MTRCADLGGCSICFSLGFEHRCDEGFHVRIRKIGLFAQLIALQVYTVGSTMSAERNLAGEVGNICSQHGEKDWGPLSRNELGMTESSAAEFLEFVKEN